MDDTVVQWIGSDCGRHGSYTFYRGFRISVDDKVKNYCLGEFYFVRNSCDQPICIAELQLVWYDANTDSKLASARLYFYPNDTPFGRQNSHGEDELLYADQKVVLKCADMVSWECSGAQWSHGLIALNESNFIQKNGSFLVNDASLSNSNDSAVDKSIGNEGTSKIIILTFPAYCRYRALLKRLAGSYLTKAHVLALGGIIASDNQTRIMFCRDCFHHPDLDKFELSGETRAPVLKGRPRRKKKLRGVPVTNVLKKKKFIADIQSCLSEEQQLSKRLKTSDEEDTESDRSEASAKSSDVIQRDSRLEMPNQKQRPPPLTKPVAQAKHLKVGSIPNQNGLFKTQVGSSVTDTLSEVPPLVPANKPKNTATAQEPKVCVPFHGSVQSLKQTVTPLKTDLQPPPNSVTKSAKPSSSVKIRQELAASIKTEKDVDSERLSSLHSAKVKLLDGSIKPNAASLVSMVKHGVGRLQNSVSFVTSDVRVKAEVKPDPEGRQPRCIEGQGAPAGKDLKEEKENVKGNPPKKRKRLRQPGDLKDGLEEYEDEDEKFFMHSLRNFMKARNTPIGKIPALGFKKVNLWTMYNTTQKLGGYDVVTSKRLWRYVYDSLGGSTTITSAATYSRRHYERLLLPYERYVRSQLLKKKDNSSPNKPEPPDKPSPVKLERSITAGPPVSSCPSSSVKSPTGPATVTASSQASPRKSDSWVQASPQVKGATYEAMAVGAETLSSQQFSKVETERRSEGSRIPTTIHARMRENGATVRVPPGEAHERPLSKQLPGATQKATAEEQHDVPRVLSREQVTSKESSREENKVPKGASREQLEVTRAPPGNRYCGPLVTSQSQPSVLSVSREHSTPKDRHNTSRGFSRECHGMQQYEVPRISSKGQDNALAKKAQEQCSALGTSSKEQRRVGTKQCDTVVPQREFCGVSSHERHSAPGAPEPKTSVKASHESSQRPAKSHRDLPAVRLPEEQHNNILQGTTREQEGVRPRTLEVPKMQRGIPRTPPRDPHSDHPSRGRVDVTEATHPTQKDVPRLPSRDGHAGPVGGEKAPPMNERSCPRSRLEMRTSMGVIDLTDSDSSADARSAYISQACTPFTSSYPFSRYPHTLTAHDVREAMMGEPHRAIQQIQQAVCTGHARDDQPTAALHSQHDRKLSSKLFSDRAAREKTADAAHTKIKQRFHPYLDERRFTHSPSRDMVEEHLGEWQRKAFAQRPHGIMTGMQAPTDGFHFFPSPYGYLPREPDCPQERRNESRKESSTEKPQELSSPYPEPLAFQTCLSPAAISEASAFAAMRSAHASATKEDVEHLYPTSRIFMPPPQLFPQMVPMSPSVLAAGPLIAGTDEQFHIHPHCLMAAPYAYPGGSASIPYPLHSFT